MNYKYKPSGVCSSEFTVDIDDTGIIHEMRVRGGCDGNSKGISQLVKNRHMDEVIELLAGIQCGRKKSSCPDQLAQMLRSIQKERAAAASQD